MKKLISIEAGCQVEAQNNFFFIYFKFVHKKSLLKLEIFAF